MNETEKNPAEKLHHGKVVSVRGSIVDVKFGTNLPFINSVLRTGKKMEIILDKDTDQDKSKDLLKKKGNCR